MYTYKTSLHKISDNIMADVRGKVNEGRLLFQQIVLINKKIVSSENHTFHHQPGYFHDTGKPGLGSHDHNGFAIDSHGNDNPE
jgi:hypothetical protein